MRLCVYDVMFCNGLKLPASSVVISRLLYCAKYQLIAIPTVSHLLVSLIIDLCQRLAIERFVSSETEPVFTQLV